MLYIHEAFLPVGSPDRHIDSSILNAHAHRVLLYSNNTMLSNITRQY